MGAGSTSCELESEHGNGIIPTTSSARNRLRNQFRSVVISPSPPSSQVTHRATPTGDAFDLIELSADTKGPRKHADPNFVDNAPMKEQSEKKISVRNLLAKAASNQGGHAFFVVQIVVHVPVINIT